MPLPELLGRYQAMAVIVPCCLPMWSVVIYFCFCERFALNREQSSLLQADLTPKSWTVYCHTPTERVLNSTGLNPPSFTFIRS